MRQGSHSKRSRGRGGNRRSGTPNRNYTFDSNGPEIRIRGNAHQVHEKYINLAREASTNGEVVLAESYFQHAEHYYRILSAFGDDSNSDGNKNRPNSSSPHENTNDGSQNNNSPVSTGTKTDLSTSDNGARPEDDPPQQPDSRILRETKKPNGDATNPTEESEVTLENGQPTLALRSGERLNVGNSTNHSLVPSKINQTTKLKNTPSSARKKTDQSEERTRSTNISDDDDLADK